MEQNWTSLLPLSLIPSSPAVVPCSMKAGNEASPLLGLGMQCDVFLSQRSSTYPSQLKYMLTAIIDVHQVELTLGGSVNNNQSYFL